MIRPALLILTIGILPTLLHADDFDKQKLDNWHQWRGPEATGVAPHGDPPVRWDEKTNVKWKTPIPGKGSSTPIIWGDQVFIQTAVDTGMKADRKDIIKPDPAFKVLTEPPTTYYDFIVMGLDRATGKVRWKEVLTRQVPHEGIHPTHSYAAYSPTTDGKFLYVSFGSRGIYCCDMNGKVQWKRDLGRMHTRLGWGEGSSPTIHGDTLIVNWDQEVGSFIVALNAKTGETRWKKVRDEVTSWATPLVVEHGGKKQVIVNGTKKVRGYDLATGKVIWECGGQTLNAIPCPVVSDGLAICMSGYKGSAVDAIPLDSTGDVTGKTAWHHDRGTPYVPSPLLLGGRLYFTYINSNLLTCLEARSGKVIVDRERLPSLKTLYGSPTAAKDRIYIIDRDGLGLVLKHGAKIEVLSTNRLDEAIDASPAIVGKQMFLRGEKHLYCIEEKN